MSAYKKTLMIAAGAVLALSACGGSQEPAQTTTVTEPAPTVTETTEADPEPVPTVTETVPAEPAPEDADLDELAMQMTWDEMTATEQDDICYGWLMDGAGEGTFDEDVVRAFFDSKCGV